MSHEQAIEKVIEFCKKHGFDDEPICLQVEERGKYFDVAMLKPYGLFIIRPDGSIEDNYETFGKAG